MPKDNGLHKAAGKGDIIEVQELLDNIDTSERANFVNLVGSQGRTAIMRACSAKSMEVFQCLVKYGASCSALDSHRRNVYHFSAISNALEILEYLVENETTVIADINQVTNKGSSCLHSAVSSHSIEAVDFLLSKTNVDVSLKNDEGMTAYELAENKKLSAITTIFKRKGLANNKSSACDIL